MIQSFPAERGLRPWAWMLAIAVHGAFLMVLVFGVAWRHTVTPPMEAELWADLPAPATVTKPVPPTPLPPPAPSVAAPAPAPAQAPPQAADIALKKQQEAAEEARRQALKQREREVAEQIRQQRTAALREQEQDEARHEANEERRKQAAQIAQAAQQARAAMIDRYKLAIINKIRANTEVPEGVANGVTLEVDITVLPTGEILMPVKIIKPSGSPPYDQAVLRGIMRSQPLPLPGDPELRRDFRTTHLQLKHEK